MGRHEANIPPKGYCRLIYGTAIYQYIINNTTVEIIGSISTVTSIRQFNQGYRILNNLEMAVAKAKGEISDCLTEANNE